MDEDKQIADGLSAVASIEYEMGHSDSVARENVVALWRALGSPAGAFSAAAISSGRGPLPPQESVAKTERMNPIREMLGATGPTDQLSAALRGRALLEQLADELG